MGDAGWFVKMPLAAKGMFYVQIVPIGPPVSAHVCEQQTLGSSSEQGSPNGKQAGVGEGSG